MSTLDSFIRRWSTTPASNGVSPNIAPYGWQEGMAPSEVNDTARQNMTDHRYQWEDAEWFCWGDTVSKNGSATIMVNGVDATTRYLAGRRLKVFADATRYATVVSSSYSAPDTKVICDFDTGSVGTSCTAVALAIISPNNTSMPGNTNQTQNLIINGQFRISQRGATFTSATTPANSDDTYLLDRWTLLSDGNDIVDVSQETTTVPTGVSGAILLDVETANKKFGIIQFIEYTDALRIIGGKASLSFKARKGGSNATLETLRCAILSWSSTQDAVTSDVVSAWNVAGTDPTLVANWTYENTPSNLVLTTAYKTFKVENISIDTASTTNVAVFIWCDDADATVADLAYISAIKLNPGSVASPFEQELINVEIEKCQRYFFKTFTFTVTPSDSTGDPNGALVANAQVVNINNSAAFGETLFFPVEMRTLPTITLYNYRTAGTDGQWDNGSASLANAASTAIGTRAALLYDSGATASVGRYYIHATASAEL